MKREAESSGSNYADRSHRARTVLADEFASVMPKNLAWARLRLGFSQDELAKKMGTTQPRIANIESGKRRIFFDTAMQLADALSLSLDQLRGFVEFDEQHSTKTTVVVE
jgi:transcriptional regulator with XRE-family HTH domain